ncbi:MAG: nucleotidyltransferase family protein [Bacteroidales bacterium]|nr:nucleotidyltransferase family protein [Bacteroidales bacterium]
MDKYQKINKTILSSLINYNPEMIGLFGSYSRNENKKESDIDIYVKFKESLSLLQLIRIENELSEKLGLKVDLVTEGAINNMRIKSSIEKDLKIIYRA